jgi:hypothetical protein
MTELTKSETSWVVIAHLEATVWAAAYAAWLPLLTSEQERSGESIDHEVIHENAVLCADDAVATFRTSIGAKAARTFS